MKKQDLTFLNWSKSRKTSGTAGSFLKAYDDTGKIKKYYKLSNFYIESKSFGHECINEVVVDRLLNILGFNHLNYELIYADIAIDEKRYETYLCSSNDFKKSDEKKSEIDMYYELAKKENESPLQFCIRMGFEKEIYQMIIIDFIICNRDRHGANIELLKDSKGKLRMAPLFDHGLSLFFNEQDLSNIKITNYLEDKKVQSFIGGSSLFENLNLLDFNKAPAIKRLTKDDKKYIFEDIDKIMPPAWINAVWKLINKRIEYYENIRVKKQK
ncbi:MAG: hypothetical protein KBT35_02205 [Firmicutes bacterium]|nr:hypothetical protein [Candidatus Colivicinus equi]